MIDDESAQNIFYGTTPATTTQTAATSVSWLCHENGTEHWNQASQKKKDWRIKSENIIRGDEKYSFNLLEH